MMEPRPSQWALALLFALVAHLALAMLLEPPEPIELEDPGIRIALGGSGPAGRADTADASTPLTETLALTGMDAVQPVAEALQATQPEPPPPIAAIEPLKSTAKPEAIKSREAPPPSPARTARAEQKPQPKSTPKPKAVKPQPSSPKPPPPKTASAGTDTGSTSGTMPATRPPGGSGGAVGTDQGGKSKNRYYSELAAWLERHKRYPARARQLRQEGVVRVRFVIDRSGKLVSHRIESSSGHNALDQAASDLLRRASPMPAIPSSLGSRLEIVVPIAYRLR
jgi:periplasmic protein TonB